MPKPKDSLALFEIMRSSEPQGPKKETSTASRQARTATPSEPPTADGQPSTTNGDLAAAAARNARPADDRPSRPWFEIAGGQVRFAFTSQGMAVAIFALALLVVAAYAVGLWVGNARGEKAGYRAAKLDTQAAVMDDIQAARAEPPAESLFEGVGTSPIVRRSTETAETLAVDLHPASADEPAWVRGYTYVVVQDFRADAWADVEKAQRYLLDNGIETAVVELDGDWKYRLVARQGFNRDDPVQRKLADEFLVRVRTVGEAFFQAGGRYRLEGYFKKLTADHW